MNADLENLIQKRKRYINALKENSPSKISEKLNLPYQNTAHFIYELLKIADDMTATEVHIELCRDKVEFRYNRGKNSFSVTDIETITDGIFEGQRDYIPAGRFGVGFKEVFSHTRTPFVHSGKYHFKIENYCIPEFQGVPEINTIDEDGDEWTVFLLPFNNPQKPENMAYLECLDLLKSLDFSVLLFLQNIMRIEYGFSSGETGYIQKTAAEGFKHHISIEQRSSNGAKSISRWLYFQNMVDIENEGQILRDLPVAIAFKLEYDSTSQTFQITPVNGQTFCYFPLEKEKPKLGFHIFAPFALNSSMDRLIACEENAKLFGELSHFIVESLNEIKCQKLITPSFLNALPTRWDELTGFYAFIQNNIYSAFRENAYLPLKSGGYVVACDALYDRFAYDDEFALANLLSNNDIYRLCDVREKWLINISSDSRAYRFLSSICVREFTIRDFLPLIFDSKHRKNTESYLQTKSKTWLWNFYSLCRNGYRWYFFHMNQDFVENVEQTAIVLSENGNLFKAADIYFLKDDTYKNRTEGVPLVDKFFAGHYFLRDELKISYYGPKIEIEQRLKRCIREVTANDQYFEDLLAFAKYQDKYGDVDFSKVRLFLSQEKKQRILSSSLVLGKNYGNDVGHLFVRFLGKHYLWDGYAKHYTNRELQLFLKFAISCGVVKTLVIRPERFGFWYRGMNDPEKNKGYRNINIDYMMPNLLDLILRKSIEGSKLIWRTLEKYGSSNSEYDYSIVRYRSNAYAEIRSKDPEFICILKKYAWIPDKQGNMFKPQDISLSDLRRDFVYNPQNRILARLGIGSALIRQSRK